MPRLTMAVYGFFLYPIADGCCATFAAPAIRDDHFAHSTEMVLYGAIKTWNVDGRSKIPQNRVLRVQNCRIRVGPAAGPAVVGNAHLIPNFSSLCCGVRIGAHWAQHHATMAEALVELNGGKLTAYADNYTNLNAWLWRDCNGEPVVRQTTSLIVYTQPTWEGTLTFTPTETDGTKGTIVFDGNADVGLRHKPTKPTKRGLEEDIDRAHAAATRRLCHPVESDIILPTRVDPPAVQPTVGLQEDVRKFLDLDTIRPEDATAKGRPNCGARLMFL